MPKTTNKRQRPRIPKEQRQNLRLWAEGNREKVLRPHLDNYATARDLGWVKERAYLQKVCNEYHARISWRLEDHEEPELTPYDPEAIVASETLDDDEEILKRKRIKVLKGRIRRWFTYRIRRRRNLASGLNPHKNPFATLMNKLTGLSAPPKARQAYQQFMRESYAEKIAPLVAARWADARANNEPGTAGRKEPKAGFRTVVAREVFGNLPDDERKAIGQRAKDEAAEAKKAYEAALKAPPSNKPVDRQRCIEALPDFLEPIFRGVYEHTGLHAMVVLGGPMPKYGGDLRTVNFAVGRNKAAAAVPCTQWAKERFNQQVLKFMTDYLGTAFDSSDCAAAALPAADLNAAKYTIGDDDDVLDGDLSDPSDSDDSDSDSGSEDEEEAARAAKKRKTAKKAAAVVKPVNAQASSSTSPPNVTQRNTHAASRSPSPVRPVESPVYASIDDVPYEDLTYEQKRARNMQRNKMLALGLGLKDDVRGSKDSTAADESGEEGPAPVGSAEEGNPETVPQVSAIASASSTGGGGTTGTTTSSTAPTPSTERGAAEGEDANEGEAGRKAAGHREGSDTSDDDMAGRQDEDGDVDMSTRAPLSRAPSPPQSLSRAPSPPHTDHDGDMDIDQSDLENMDLDNDDDDDAGADTGLTTPPPAPSRLPSPPLHSSSTPAQPTPTTAESDLPTCPPRAPEWFVHAYQQMTQHNLGVHFNAVLAAWIRIEDASRFEHSGSITKKLRPQQVNIWIQYARGKKGGADLTVKNPTEYEKQFCAWWDSLQPAWRRRDSAGAWLVSEPYGKEWDALCCWGQNACLSIVAGLYFWGRAVDDSEQLLERWEMAVNDVAWVFEGLAIFHEAFKKRF
ncbi:hypothetical protein C8R46DRAFT_1035961 [Mycena filopes]|nr:hypothetical protein C8R46DRAFT_1035961 [Mycena filopes]